MLVTDNRVAGYVGQKAGTEFHPPFTCLGVERDGRILAGVVFNSWTGPDVHLTIAAERGGLSRGFLRRVAIYVTEELGCIRATIETEQPHVVDMVQRMGGKIEAVKRNLFGVGRNGTVVGILKNEWRLG